MLYDEVKRLIKKSSLSKNFKTDMQNRTRLKLQEINQTAEEAITALHTGIDDTTVILIDDNKKIFEEIQDIKIDQFRDIKFPFANFFIELNMPKSSNNKNEIMTLGLHVYPDSAIGLRSDNIYNVFMYTMKNNKPDNLVPLMAILKLDKLPRFYVGCSKPCNNMINPSNLGSMINRAVCQRTERTAEQCVMSQFLLYGIKIIIYVVNLINSKPQTLQEETREERIKRHIPQISYNSKPSKSLSKPNKYIYISVEQKKYRNLKVNRTLPGHRRPPSPHTRRGHFRHYKTGKVVWVEMSYIGLKEQSNKKIYKVK